MEVLYILEVGILIIASILGAVLYRHYRKASYYPACDTLATSIPSAAPVSKALIFLVVLLAGKILWEGFTYPLNWDETVHLSSLVEMDLNHDLNPFRFSHHALSSIATLLSLWSFGVSPEAARIPSICFSIVTCLMLLKLCKGRFAPVTLFLILGHFMTNRELGFNLFSQRAYALMTLLSVSIYTLLVKFSENERGLSSKDIWAFFILSGASFFTHLYSGFFVGLVASYVFLILAIHGNLFSKEKIRSGSMFALSGIFWVAVFGLTFPQQLKMLKEYGHALTGTPPTLWEVFHNGFILAFGFSFRRHEWLFSLIAILTLAALFYQLAKRRIPRHKGYLYLFPVFMMVAFTGTTLAFKTDVFTRMFAWFYIPAIVTLSETWVSAEKSWPTRFVQIALAVTLILFPYYHAGIPTGGDCPGNLAEFSRFMKEVRSRTAPVENNCYEFAGDSLQSIFAGTIYLNRLRSGIPGECKKTYLLYFAKVPANHPPENMPKPKLTNIHELITDRYRSRILYEKVTEAASSS